LNTSTVLKMTRTWRRLAAGGALTLLFASWAPLAAFACSGTTAGSAGTASGGGGLTNPFDWVGGPTTYAVSAGFLLLVVIGLAAIVLTLTMRRRPAPALIAQLSSDGRYWWDGIVWHDSVLDTPPQAVRSADGAYWWDGSFWRPFATT
jgi:hypothetical protein